MSSFDAELERLEEELLKTKISGLITALAFTALSWYFQNYVWFGLNVVLVIIWVVSLILYFRKRK